jgi:hypothetical protein
VAGTNARAFGLQGQSLREAKPKRETGAFDRIEVELRPE